MSGNPPTWLAVALCCWPVVLVVVGGAAALLADGWRPADLVDAVRVRVRGY